MDTCDEHGLISVAIGLVVCCLLSAYAAFFNGQGFDATGLLGLLEHPDALHGGAGGWYRGDIDKNLGGTAKSFIRCACDRVAT